MNQKFYCIYRITNKINGRTYIGQHKYSNEKDPIKNYWGGGKLLHRAYEKYGKENFDREVIYCRIRDRETADAMEIWMITKERKENKNGCYNIAKGGQGGCGTITEETRKKISKANKGRIFSEEHKRKLSESHKGHHLSEEQKRKIGEKSKGRQNTKGMHWTLSEETKRKMSEAAKHRKYSEEVRRKMSESAKRRGGHPISDETKRKIGEANKTAWAKRKNTSQVQ